MEHIIDIQLVKEQLRLLGHEVDDGVIIDFVRGLNKVSAGASQTEGERNAGDQDVRPQQPPAAAAVDTSSKSKAARAPASGPNRDTDAAPSKLQQAPDQQSPKRPMRAAAPEKDSPAVPMPQHAALDQRCRNFLSRCSDTPSSQQEQVQQQQQLPLQPVLLHVPHVQDSARLPGAAGSSSPQSGSSSRSSELLLGDAGNDTDSTDGSTHGLGAHTAASWAQPPSTQQYQQLAQLGAELDGRDSGDDSDSDGSSLVLEAEGSKFLLHQAATMQRVRARLAAKMARYAAAASAQEESSGANQLQTSASAAAAAAAARLGAGSSGAASSASNSSSAANSSSELPRFGFRPGYTPVGIHMPPPLSAAAVEALAAARTLRQQVSTEGGSAGAAPMAAGSSKAAAVPPLRLDLPLNMQSLTSAVNRLHEQQQQQASRKGHSRLDPVLLPGAIGGVLHPIVSPGKAACASSVAAARASASIIGETPPCMASAAAGHKTRQSPRVDPLYLAPSSPRRSNPATPRSSPALSPAPLAAPLPAAAAGPGPLRSPAAAAPAAAVGARRSGSSATAKQSLTFSAGSRGAAAARGSAHHHQQHQRGEAGGAGRRASSAPPTPSAGAPGGALRGLGPGGVGGSSASGGCYSARRSAAVSHESLYCQRLSSACGGQRSTVAPGVRKTDRVARFQQMQQQWSRDRFLSSGAGGAAKKSAGQ